MTCCFIATIIIFITSAITMFVGAIVMSICMHDVAKLCIDAGFTIGIFMFAIGIGGGIFVISGIVGCRLAK